MQCLDSDPKELVDMLKHGIEYASGSKRIISRSSSISNHSDADSSFNRRDSKLREPITRQKSEIEKDPRVEAILNEMAPTAESIQQFNGNSNWNDRDHHAKTDTLNRQKTPNGSIRYHEDQNRLNGLDPRIEVIIRQKSPSDSVRSATIRRSGVNRSNPSLDSFRVKENTKQRGGIPVMIPTPHLNGAEDTKKKVEKKPSIPLGMILRPLFVGLDLEG